MPNVVGHRHQETGVDEPLGHVRVSRTVLAQTVGDDHQRTRRPGGPMDVVGDLLSVRTGECPCLHAAHRIPSRAITLRPADSRAPSGRVASSPISTMASTRPTTRSIRATTSAIRSTVAST